jgi:hypothetical protein
MRAVWAWRAMLLVAVPALALVAVSVGTQLPHAVRSGSQDLEALLAWGAAALIGTLLVLLSVALRRAGRLSAAIVAVSLVALPAAFGVGGFLFVVLLFVLNG